MAKTKNSESFAFLVAVGVVVGLILAFVLSDAFRKFVYGGWRDIELAAFWFFTTTYALPVWLITVLVIMALTLVVAGIYRYNESRQMESEEYKTSYRRYVTDTFDGVLWSWNYFGGRPVRLYAICENDKTPMVYIHDSVTHGHFSDRVMIWLKCETCGHETKKEYGSDASVIEDKIERQILRKIHSNEYLRHLPPIE